MLKRDILRIRQAQRDPRSILFVTANIPLELFKVLSQHLASHQSMPELNETSNDSIYCLVKLYSLLMYQ